MLFGVNLRSGVCVIQIMKTGFRRGRCSVVNKDKTGGSRQSRLREERAKWLAENAYGLSAEGLIGALMRGECSLSWSSVPTKRAADGLKRGAKNTASSPRRR